MSGQAQLPATPSGDMLAAVTQDYTVAERGPNHRVWQRVVKEPGPAGSTREVKHSYVELATGMHYLQGGAWVDAAPEIVVGAAGSALGQRAQHKVQFAPNLKTPGAIEVTTPTGNTLRSHVLGIYFYDWKTRQSVQLGTVKDSAGTLIGKNQVQYGSGFAGVKASVRYTFKKFGVSQDIVFQEQLPAPADSNLDPETTEVEVWTEFLNPPPAIKRSRVDKQTGREIVSVLDFGDMVIGQGTAFLGTSGAGVNSGNGAQELARRHRGIPVKKEWISLEGRTFLIEAVPYRLIRTQLAALPQHASSSKPAARNVQLALGRSAPPRLEAQPPTPRKMEVASVSTLAGGFLLDYEIIDSNYQPSTLLSGTTYYASDYFYGNDLTLEAGCVVKAGTSGGIDASTLTCPDNPYFPAVITAVDDDTVGEVITGVSTGTPNGYYNYNGLVIWYPWNEIKNLEFRYAGLGLCLADNTEPPITISDCRFLHCGNAVSFLCYNGVALRNCLFHDTQTAFYLGTENGLMLGGHNLTLDGVTQVMDYSPYAVATVGFTNCIFAMIGGYGVTIDVPGEIWATASHNGFFNSSSFGMQQFPALASPFQTLGLRHHYLVSSSSFIDQGDRTAAAASLDVYTTQTDQTTDTGMVDLGYHYQPVLGPGAGYASPNPAQTCPNVPVGITLHGSDPQGLPVTFSYTVPAHGTLSGTPPSLVYTPTTSYCGEDSFSFTVNNGYLESPPTTVTAYVGDPAPQANCQGVLTGKNMPVTITLGGHDICGLDLDIGQVNDGWPQHGTLSVFTPVGATHSTVTYTPVNDYEGVDYFAFTATGCAGASAAAPVTVYVVPGPVLTTECRRNRIILRWTVPQWIENDIGSGFIHDFQIYRCEATAEACTPTQVYDTESDPNARVYVDTGVESNKRYCYRVTFRYQNPCDLLMPLYESPFSNTGCNQVCQPPLLGPVDVAFIVDNTGSMGQRPLTELRNGITLVLDDIDAASSGDYRLALVTPDNDQVDVRVPFPASGNNRGAFESGLNSNLQICGDGITRVSGNEPAESTDECLDTVLEARPASGRANPRDCTPKSSPLQFNDFLPGFRPSVRKLVIMITDQEPGGFYDSGDSGAQAAVYASLAHDNCVKINAIQIGSLTGTTQDTLLNYCQTSCGWYAQLPASGIGIAEAVVSMLYVPGYCNCP